MSRSRTEAESINGRFVNCPNYQGTKRDAYQVETVFRCKLFGERVNCSGCGTCPKCGGRVYIERKYISHGQMHTILTKDMKCLACGLYTTEQILVPKESRKKKQTRTVNGQRVPPPCSVKGCQHRAWDGQTVEIDTDTGPRTFPVCDTHKRRMKTWKRHKDKGLDKIPLIYFMGELIDNPEYKYSKKGH